MKIFKRFWISRLREIFFEVAVARGDDEEPDEEVVKEDTENGSKGTKKANDEEDHAIDIDIFSFSLNLIYLANTCNKYPCLNCDVLQTHLPRPKYDIQAAWKPKGGPLDEKTILFKNVPQSF